VERRALLYGVVGLGIVVLLASGSFELYRLLEALLRRDGVAQAAWFYSGRVTLATALTAGLLAAYHAWVLRSEPQRPTDEVEGAVLAPPAQLVLLAARADAGTIAAFLAERGPADVWWREGEPSGVSTEALNAAVAGLPGGARHALLHVELGAVRAVIFEPDS
jgi:hypothetical protein